MKKDAVQQIGQPSKDSPQVVGKNGRAGDMSPRRRKMRLSAAVLEVLALGTTLKGPAIVPLIMESGPPKQYHIYVFFSNACIMPL